MKKYKNVVVLTGAGISQESGLNTFRGHEGLWENHRVEDVATPEAFIRDPELVYRFYNHRRENLKNVEPNLAHFALSKLEEEFEGNVTIITQNIDNLHERGGSNKILHMHGEVTKARCYKCGDVHPWDYDFDGGTSCPSCKIKPALRPHIVWFGEMPFFMNEINFALEQADIFISIGTSGNVYPAAGFIAQIRTIGSALTVELNLEPSEGSHLFDVKHHGLATKTVPKFINKLLKAQIQ
ncbi:MAG: Sir2 family NAD+-dependent deacetylase [Sphingomonadales bacterium]